MTKYLICVTSLILMCVGCQSGDVQPASGNQKITLQLNWRADAQHGGFYAALVGGEYAKEGLDVEIVQGGPGSPVLPKLVMGRVDFAIANADQILQVREQDADVVGVFAPLQHSPRCIMVHESSGITSLEDLNGVTLGMNEGRTFAIFLRSKLSLDDVRIVPYGGAITKFVNDPKFAQQGYVFSEPMVARKAGSDPKALMVSELGFDPYTSTVVARSKMCDEQPDLVAKFVAATRRGWESYLKDPAAANAKINEINSDMDLDSLTQAVEAVRPLCEGAVGEFGSMTAERWQALATQMKSIDAISGDADEAAKTAWRAIE